MSHLIIEQGREVGQEITVPSGGMKFGRSPANDLVLEDEVLMLFQGRFFFKSDGTLWITDFSVAEKSHIGGIPIDEQQLKVGDLVEVGSTAFRVISTRQETEASAVPVAPSGEEIDLGFKPAGKAGRSGAAGEKSGRQTSPTYRLLQVAVIILVLLLIVVGVTEFAGARGKARGRGVYMEGVFFSYEYVRGDSENIFRYALDLTPQGVATLSVDNVRNRHLTKTAQLAPADLQELIRKIEDSGFFSITGDRIGEVSAKYDQYDIVLGCNGKFNHVRVVNRELPGDMRDMVTTLEQFAFNALDISLTLLKDDATLIRYAQDAYRLGEDRFRERDTGPENLALSINHLKEAMAYLETLEPKPEPYEQAVALMERARAEQDRRYEEYMFAADRAIRIADWQEARRNLRILVELIPDRTDDRYRNISEKMLMVEDRLR